MASAPIAALIFLYMILRPNIPPSNRAVLAVPVLASALLASPSLHHGWINLSSSQATTNVPEHLKKFQSLQGSAPSILDKGTTMFRGMLAQLDTMGADGGLHELFAENSPILFTNQMAGWTLQVLLLASLAWAVFRTARPGRAKPPAIIILLLCVVLLPPLLTAVLLSRPNPSYLVGSIPFLMLLMAWSAYDVTARLRPQTRGLVSAAIAGVLIVPTLPYPETAKSLIERSEPPWPIQGQYYLPLKEQRRVAAYFAREGITEKNLFHISGDYFAYPYRTLLKRLGRGFEPSTGAAVMEDLDLRGLVDQGHADWLSKRLPVRHGNVASRVFPDKETAANFVEAFRNIPPTSNQERTAP